MIKLNRAEYELVFDETFPVYWKASDKELETAVYDSDAWGHDPENYYYIITFDDIRNDFDGWSEAEREEYLQDSNTPDYTVYDWIRDCLMNSLAVIKGFKRKEE